jgi:exosortase/archaeosortase family protein
LALFITSVVAGYMFLESHPRRILLALCVFPITIFKNSLRIATLAVLGSYVDPSWVTSSWLHRMGGKPFFILALLFMLPVLWLLRRSEKKRSNNKLTADERRPAQTSS